MQRFVLVCAFLALAVTAVFGDDSAQAPASVITQFDAATTAGKVTVLQQAGQAADVDMTPVYEHAASFIISNPALIRGDADGTALAAQTLQLVSASKDSKAAASIVSIFELSTVDSIKASALQTLSVVAPGNGDALLRINSWLNGQNLLHQSGSDVDVPIVDAVVKLLGTIGDASSFPIVYAAMTEGYSSTVTDDARSALLSIPGSFQTMLASVIAQGPWADRVSALSMAMGAPNLAAAQRAALVTSALQTGVAATGQDAADKLRTTLLVQGCLAAGKLAWSPATGIVVKAFNILAGQYGAGNLDAPSFASVIAAVGSLGTHEAAVRLSLYLGYEVSAIRQGSPVDQTVLLAVVASLQNLRDRIAVSNLTSLSYAEVSPAIRSAAQTAVQAIQQS